MARVIFHFSDIDLHQWPDVKKFKALCGVVAQRNRIMFRTAGYRYPSCQGCTAVLRKREDEAQRKQAADDGGSEKSE